MLKSLNMEYEDRILIISHQLKQSNARVDKLSVELTERPHDSSAVEKIKTELSATKLSYENQITDLKRTIQKYSTFVSQDEYRRVKTESERNASILSIKIEEINSLSMKVKDLEDRLKRSEESLQLAQASAQRDDHNNRLISPTSTEGDSSPMNHVDAPPESGKMEADFVSEVSSPTQQISPTSNAIFKFSSLSRRDIIRAAGGHSALNERLKKSRCAMIRSKDTDAEPAQKTSPVSLYAFRSPLASIQDNGRALAIRLASHGKENVTCQ